MSFIIDLVRSSDVRAATEMIEISFPIELTKSTSLGHDLFQEDKIEKFSRQDYLFYYLRHQL
jgi:hypothetical protein